MSFCKYQEFRKHQEFPQVLYSQQLQQPEGEDSGEVSQTGYPAEMAEIPAERYSLEAHDHDSGGRTDYQHAASYAGAIGK